MRFNIKDKEVLEKFSEKLSILLHSGDVVSLIGDLGVGKTTLVQSITKFLGVNDYVTSPTFSIVNIYNGNQNIYHLDLYRLEEPCELEQIDFENYFYPNGLTFIEWAKQGGDYLPQSMIEIELIKVDNSPEERIIEIKENCPRAIEIGEKLNESFSY